MWRKKDRLAGGKLTDCLRRGEWAELYFMMQAAGHGMKVFCPFGQIGRYDVGVENQARLLRVQVKTTLYKNPRGGYTLKTLASHGKKYDPGEVDFFAVLVIPIDSWYIFPIEVIGENTGLFFKPSVRDKRQKYAPYREAWHLLQDTELTIRACADPNYPGVEGNKLEMAQADSGFLDSAISPASRVILVRSE